VPRGKDYKPFPFYPTPNKKTTSPTHVKCVKSKILLDGVQVRCNVEVNALENEGLVQKEQLIYTAVKRGAIIGIGKHKLQISSNAFDFHPKCVSVVLGYGPTSHPNALMVKQSVQIGRNHLLKISTNLRFTTHFPSHSRLCK
jgi:hypothetical protein